MPTRTHDGIKKRCECPRKRWPSCTHGWHFSFHYGGVEHRYSLDKVARARGERRPDRRAIAWRDRAWRDSTARSSIRGAPGGPRRLVRDARAVIV